MPPRRPRPRYEDPEYDPVPIYLDELEEEESGEKAAKKSARKRPAARRKKDEMLEETEQPSGFMVGTTAEGVETQEQLNRLQEMGCSQVQGYFLAKP
ncbi:MAG: EAL domain-containing protein, partial [Aggregatilineales bacterium]